MELKWKSITLGDKSTNYEISTDGHIRRKTQIRLYPSCDKINLVESKLVKTKNDREREVVTLFHDNKALCIDLEALYIHTFHNESQNVAATL